MMIFRASRVATYAHNYKDLCGDR